MPEPLAAVVLDFDGVVLQSVDIKTRAFAALFAQETPAAAARIVEYHRANGGVSRFEKFRWAYREVLKRPLSSDEEKRLGERFNALVEEAVSRCPFVPGAPEFLEQASKRLPLFVNSGTPEIELRRIVERRNLSSFFNGVFGAPKKKDEILRHVAGLLNCEPARLAMVGDAMTDHDAAKKTGARFIGVLTPGESDPFPAGTATIPDLRGLDAALAAAAR